MKQIYWFKWNQINLNDDIGNIKLLYWMYTSLNIHSFFCIKYYFNATYFTKTKQFLFRDKQKTYSYFLFKQKSDEICENKITLQKLFIFKQTLFPFNTIWLSFNEFFARKIFNSSSLPKLFNTIGAILNAEEIKQFWKGRRQNTPQGVK